MMKQSSRSNEPSMPPWYTAHLKVVGGLMVEMTQPEKDAVDAPLLAEQAHNAAMQDEWPRRNIAAPKRCNRSPQR